MLSTVSYIPTALADKDDLFSFSLNSQYTHDSNLFRLPAGTDPVGQGAERSDNIWKNTYAFSLDKKYSLQRFRFDYWHEDVNYDNAKFLNFNGNNYQGTWFWAVTPALKGILLSKRTVDLVPFLDYRNDLNPGQRNLRTTEFQMFNFDYSPHNVWHLLGGVSHLEVDNSQTFVQEQSFRFKAAEAGLQYSFPSESYFKYMARHRDGSQQDFAAIQVSDGFIENEQELSMLWILSGKSKLTSNVGYLDRDDNDFAIRDFNGWFGGINYAWDVTGKVNLTFDLSRKIAAYQDANSSYTTNDAFTIKPTWAATSKIKVSGLAQIGKRKFLGDGPGTSIVVGFVGSDNRKDNYMALGLGADWAPRDYIKVGANYRHEERRSNDTFDRDYSADIFSVYGQFTF